MIDINQGSKLYCAIHVQDIRCCYNNMMSFSGTPSALPSAPTTFSLRARNEFGRFDIVSANASQPVPEDQLFAFIFKVEMPDGKIHYVLQVHSVRYFNVLLLVIFTSLVFL